MQPTVLFKIHNSKLHTTCMLHFVAGGLSSSIFRLHGHHQSSKLNVRKLKTYIYFKYKSQLQHVFLNFLHKNKIPKNH